jgi:catechol 2,3-dioxygenase-like lactoylglutathione lyase family enzyme
VRALALLRVSLTVGDLRRLTAFYVEALGFAAEAEGRMDDATAALLGARAVRTVLLRRGGQTLELCEFDPPGDAYPAGSRSDDLWFQHCALVTSDIGAAFARLRGHAFAAISRDGPQALPGGISAFKFRDPDGHPLELIRFPTADMETAEGIDHSAISVADVERSVAFYGGVLGLSVVSRQVNAGPAQDAMDGLDGTKVDVVGLAPARRSPHVELLGYRSPRGRAGPPLRPADVAASRLVLRVDELARPGAVATADGGRVGLLHDPDGHALLLTSGRAGGRPPS